MSARMRNLHMQIFVALPCVLGKPREPIPRTRRPTTRVAF